MSGLLDRLQSLNEQFREALRDARNADEVNQVHWFFTGYGGPLTKLLTEVAEGESPSERMALRERLLTVKQDLDNTARTLISRVEPGKQLDTRVTAWDPVQQVVSILRSARSEVAQITDELAAEALRTTYLGRKSELRSLLKSIGSLQEDERKAIGSASNDAQQLIADAIGQRQVQLESTRLADIAETEAIDITFPGPPIGRGHVHVLTQVQRQIETVLESLGYQVELGPEVETEWYNFEALNIPPGHPARENWDSFYFTPDLLLRAHTSPVQIRAMQRIKEPPIYIITPGRCYRRDAPEATRLPYFSQVEGLAVDKALTVGDMKGTLLYMIQSLYGEERKVRVRPSYFPFTEPSFEFDVTCGICAGAGCKSCRHKGWLEVGGCGMVHPQVLRNGGIDPEKWNGYAWGFGIERMAMLKHDVDDIRLFYESDLRFLEQF